MLGEALEKFPHDDALRGTRATLLQGAGARGAYACPPSAAQTSPPQSTIRAQDWRRWEEPATALALAQRALRASPAIAQPANSCARHIWASERRPKR